MSSEMGPKQAGRSVRILLVGDRDVGKTSIILSLVNEEFLDEVPGKAETITIPAEVTPELVPTDIIDYHENEQDHEELCEQIRHADVICLVFSVVDETSQQNIKDKWMPLFRECQLNNDVFHPVILVGNKSDLINNVSLHLVEEVLFEYPEIESYVQCSAKMVMNISEMFCYAQTAILHPTAPLYSVEEKILTEKCKRALCRVFKICDTDNDGLLNDEELNNFQRHCFDCHLPLQQLNGIKTIINMNCERGISPSNCVTLEGFLFLHMLFILKGKAQTTWTVIRKFGYNDSLNFSYNYLHPNLKVDKHCTIELSHKGEQFLSRLFDSHDKDRDDCLSPVELKSLFFMCTEEPQLLRKCLFNTNHKGWITSQGWLSFWSYCTLAEPDTTLAYLAMLGYCMKPENQLSGVHVTRSKKIDLLKKQSQRSVYICHVIGSKSSGKSTICRRHVKATKIDNDNDVAEESNIISVNRVQVFGLDKYLVLKEINSINENYYTKDDIKCDVACLVFDNSQSCSFEYSAHVYLKYYQNRDIPVLIVANNKGRPIMKQDYILQPDQFCKQKKLSPPFMFVNSNEGKKLYTNLATMASLPHKYSPNQSSLMPSLRETIIFIWKTGIGFAMVALCGVLVGKCIVKSKKDLMS
ncbi:EF hand associated, type-1,EF hand associated, type-2,Small GTPase superfamily,Mitochondrial Rho [Cinara cedri]|uniref:Mitochondrial Rho GTPase n=1 Tax=Cinara cedri TaxID=506608 RepID=A0A5E4MRC7_9HEMI|nr:EF hand associated, type-1,EF hand associated, type-2,Small GTPase superfamily,Mitochondrial Rho [Cinara cedri]